MSDETELYTSIPFGCPDVFFSINEKLAKERAKKILSMKCIKPFKRRLSGSAFSEKPSEHADNATRQVKNAANCSNKAVEDLLWKVPFERHLILKETPSYMPEYYSPELMAINDYCRSRYGRPFLGNDKKGISLSDIQSEVFSSGILEKLPAVFLTAYFMSTTTTIKDSYEKLNLHKSVELLPELFLDISNRTHTDKHLDALWAISSCMVSAWPLLALLHNSPELTEHYSYLKWQDSLDGHEYKSECNPFSSEGDSVEAHGAVSSLKAIASLIIDYVESTYEGKENFRLNVAEYTNVLSKIKNLLELGERLSLTASSSKYDEFISKLELANSKLERVYSAFAKDKGTKFYSEISKSVKLDELKSIAINKVPSVEAEHVQIFIEHALFKEKETCLNSLVNLIDESVLILDECKSDLEELIKYPAECADEISKKSFKMKRCIEDIRTLEEKAKEDICLLVDDLIFQFNNIEVNTSETIEDKLSRYKRKLKHVVTEKNALEVELSALKKERNELTTQNYNLSLAVETANAKSGIHNVSMDDVYAVTEMAMIGEKPPIEMCIDYINVRFDNIVFLPSAYKSASAASEFKRVPRLLELLKTLCIDYVPSINNGTPDCEAKQYFTQNAYKANESDSVCANSKLMKHRTFSYKGDEIVMEQHLGIGTAHNKNETIRIYFKIVEGKAVVGHLGEHLPTS